ncbi:MAG: tetratricopeptide repeat protein [Fibrobacterota bacterium]
MTLRLTVFHLLPAILFMTPRGLVAQPSVDTVNVAPYYLQSGGQFFPMDTTLKKAPPLAPVLPPAPRVDYQKALDTMDAKGLRDLNERFAKLNRKEEGVDQYRKYFETHVGSETVKMAYAQLLGWSNRFEESIREYQSILKENPENGDAKMGLGLVLGWSGRYHEAESVFVTLYAKNPENLDAKINHARLLSWQGQWDEAIALLKEVVLGFPQNLYAHEALAFIYKWKHNYNDAYHHFMAITRLDGDSAVILNAHYQMAELDYWKGRTRLSTARLNDVLRKYPDARKFSDKLSEIEDFLRPRFSADLIRYQEAGQNPGGKSLSGSGNNGGVLRFEKNLSLLATLKTEFQLRNETADQVSPVKETRLYNVGVGAIHIEPEFRYKDSAVFHIFYSPTLYWNRDKARPSLDERTLFHGMGLFGTLRTFSRLYWGLTRTPWISNNGSHLTVLSRYTGNAASLFQLDPKTSLSASATVHLYEDRNVLQEYYAEAVRTLTPLFRLTLRPFSKAYRDQVPDYFTYRYWGGLDALFGAEREIGNWRLAGEALAGLNALQQDDAEQKIFGAFGLRLNPAFRFYGQHELRLSLSGLINTDNYYLYSLGLHYGM